MGIAIPESMPDFLEGGALCDYLEGLRVMLQEPDQVGPVETVGLMRSLGGRRVIAGLSIEENDNRTLARLVALEPESHGFVLGNNMGQKIVALNVTIACDMLGADIDVDGKVYLPDGLTEVKLVSRLRHGHFGSQSYGICMAQPLY